MLCQAHAPFVSFVARLSFVAKRSCLWTYVRSEVHVRAAEPVRRTAAIATAFFHRSLPTVWPCFSQPLLALVPVGAHR